MPETVARKPAPLTFSERRRKRRIRWILGIWAGLLLIAAIAYAIKKQRDRSASFQDGSERSEYKCDEWQRTARGVYGPARRLEL